jgi:hypothetical protein
MESKWRSDTAGGLTDRQARQLVIRALRLVRQAYRVADTIGEKEERELDRLIKRKTRINVVSFKTMVQRYSQYMAAVNAVQKPLSDAVEIARNY